MIYLASVYTLHRGGHEMAYRDAARATAMAMRRGLHVFSPIVHGHALSIYADFDGDHDFWDTINKPYADDCTGLLVVKMEGWQYSRGIGQEIDWFKKAGKPIAYMGWPADTIHGLRALQEAEREC